MRKFNIKYKKVSKRPELEQERNVIIDNVKETGDIGIDSKRALGIFTKVIGNLKRYDVIEIQEVDDNHNPIGQPIRPVGESAIMPSAI